jgi:hypothetical protein
MVFKGLRKRAIKTVGTIMCNTGLEPALKKIFEFWKFEKPNEVRVKRKLQRLLSSRCLANQTKLPVL